MRTQRFSSPTHRSSSSNNRRGPSLGRKSVDTGREPRSHLSGKQIVKRLRLVKALTIPESTMVSVACQRMMTRRDIATRVIAEGLRPEETPVSKVMTKNPSFVLSDTSAVEALERMVQGRFRHLPVVENGEVIALLDITKCLYDAIRILEKMAEKGDAIAAAVQGVEEEYESDISAPSNLVEMLRERLFGPSLGSIITENSKFAVASPSETVYAAARKMQELRVTAVMVTSSNRPRGILTPRDILMRVVSQKLPADSTPIEKVMTINPECGTADTSIIDALHMMHDGKFLHLPVLDQDGCIVACLDVLHLANVAVAIIRNPGGSPDVMWQRFWDPDLTMELPETDDETQSDASTAEVCPDLRNLQTLGQRSTFPYKLEDHKGRIHRFSSGIDSLTELRCVISQRIGSHPNLRLSSIMYEDDEGDLVTLLTDNDLIGAVHHARSMGQSVLRLQLGFSHATKKSSASTAHGSNEPTASNLGIDMVESERSVSAATYATIAAGAAVVVGISVLTLLKRGIP